jgi:PAS domain S-box-containing protein
LAVFTRSRNAMLLLDGERRIVDVNRALLDLGGYPREQLLGRRIDLFLDPEEWGSLDAEWRAFQRRGDFLGERSVVRADGTRVRLQYAARWAVVGGTSLALYVALDADVRAPRPAAEDDAIARPLSPRELEVVGETAMGLRAHEIADELGIAPSTVRTHLRNAMKAVGARSQAQLVAIACERGLIGPRALAAGRQI